MLEQQKISQLPFPSSDMNETQTSLVHRHTGCILCVKPLTSFPLFILSHFVLAPKQNPSLKGLRCYSHKRNAEQAPNVHHSI